MASIPAKAPMALQGALGAPVLHGAPVLLGEVVLGTVEAGAPEVGGADVELLVRLRAGLDGALDGAPALPDGDVGARPEVLLGPAPYGPRTVLTHAPAVPSPGKHCTLWNLVSF